MTVVEVRNLTFAYSGEKPLLHDISFSISDGEVFVIAGKSGSGKTTLCRILSGIIPCAIKGSLSGEIMVADITPSQAGLPKTALRAGMVFQDADDQIICSTVEDELAFGLENHCKPPKQIQRRVDELLTEFRFRELRHENPARLSDGQKKLLVVAAVLAPAPPILILDEPMNGLDNESRALLHTAIEQQRRQGRTVIIVEHDLKTVTFADNWLLLRDGSIAAFGTPSSMRHDENMLIELGVWA